MRLLWPYGLAVRMTPPSPAHGTGVSPVMRTTSCAVEMANVLRMVLSPAASPSTTLSSFKTEVPGI
ncbi:MAG: hypothetical protein WBZ40_04950 [Acidimicrobiia bacterium]